MENKVTELVFILDKSGSMWGMEEDTIGGFNAMIEKQKQQEGKVLVSTVLFSNTQEVLHDRKNLDEIAPLTENDYKVGGSTALLDAIGLAIRHIGNIHKYARKEDVPNKTMFIITTDGMENASRRYLSDKVKSMIKNQEEKYGWEFVFLASNIDAVETARFIGIREERAINYAVNSETRAMYEELGESIRRYRACGYMPEDYAEDFEKRLGEKRKKSK